MCDGQISFICPACGKNITHTVSMSFYPIPFYDLIFYGCGDCDIMLCALIPQMLSQEQIEQLHYEMGISWKEFIDAHGSDKDDLKKAAKKKNIESMQNFYEIARRLKK